MIISSIYKLLNATIGSNLEALFAGKTPKIKPIDPEMIMVEKVVVIPTDAGSGVIRNSGQLVFSTALQDWGWVSGVYIFDNATVGEGNVLMHATLDNPRIIYKGDNVKFDYKSLEISFD